MAFTITVDFSQPKTGFFAIHYKISNDQIVYNKEDGCVYFRFASWCPGSYLMREFQSHVTELEFTNSKKQKVPFKKINKNTWQVFLKKKEALHLNYQVYANRLNVRGAYLDHQMAFFNGPCLFFLPENLSTQKITLKIKKPTQWKIAWAKQKKKQDYLFKNFDELLDTPLLAAKELELTSFTVAQSRIQLAVWGALEMNTKELCTALKKIIQKQIKIFGDYPVKNYLFQILSIKGEYGGLEHSFSSTNIFDGRQIEKPKAKQSFLSLLAHEHFHLWNVKRIRPAALGPFDYFQENYTRDLWLAEGTTSYYDDMTTFLAGLMQLTDYFENIAKRLATLNENYSYKIDSLSLGSFDAWIKFYRQNENSINSTCNYYLKGMLVNLLLDFIIIKKSKARYSLDDVLKRLFKKYKERPGLGFDRSEILDTVSELINWDSKKFITDYLDGTKPIDFKKYFNDFGLEQINQKPKAAFHLGVILKEKPGKLTVQAIHQNTPAHFSKLKPHDEIIAINNRRIEKEKDLDLCLNQKKWQVIFSRLGTIESDTIELKKPIEKIKTLKALKKQTTQQQKLYDKWLRKI